MSRSPTKPCTNCGCADPKKLKNARISRWWCKDCISDHNRDYYERNRERIRAKRREKAEKRRKETFAISPDEEPRVFKLLEDPTGLYRPRLTEFKRGDMFRLVEDAYAPTGSIWRGDNGEAYEVEGEQFIEQKLVPLEAE